MDDVASVEDGALDLIGYGEGGWRGAVTDSYVVDIDHFLDFGDFGDGIHVNFLLGDLDDFCCDGLAIGCEGGGLRVESFVEVGEEVAEAFGVLWSVFVDADLVRGAVGEDDVAEEGLLEEHGAGEELA